MSGGQESERLSIFAQAGNQSGTRRTLEALALTGHAANRAADQAIRAFDH